MKYNFITGSGRSGTTFLSEMLQQIPQPFTGHEYIGDREYWLLSWYQDEAYAEEYLKRKKSEIEQTIHKPVFIDVNGYLQHSVPALNKVFKPQNVLHLVRDPRQVIRSLYTRRTDKNFHILPKDREGISRWLDGDKFYQICWNWSSANRNLLNLGLPLLQFEKLIADYNYCSEKLFLPLEVTMEKREWEQLVNIKSNASKPKWYRQLYALYKNKPYVNEEIPEYDKWTANQKNIFRDLCGDVMIKAGYSF
jgi:hypothetical protein